MTVDQEFCTRLGHEHAQDHYYMALSQNETPTLETHRALLDTRTLQGFVTVPDTWRTIGADDELWRAYRVAFEDRLTELCAQAA
ncbi:MAG: hypothetical protein IPH72_19030 [Sandaracinaceae bacterium]|nr:hypothetical protein [Sandaracinaceae bacterium]